MADQLENNEQQFERRQTSEAVGIRDVAGDLDGRESFVKRQTAELKVPQSLPKDGFLNKPLLPDLALDAPEAEAAGQDAAPAGSAEDTGTVIDYQPEQTGNKSYALGMDYEEDRDTRSIYEKLADFGKAAVARATDPEGQKAYIQGQLDKIIGIGEGLNMAKESTKSAVVAGWNALTDGTVANFLAKPNAINDPLFHAVGGALDAMANDPNAVNHTLERVGTVIMEASERYTAAPNREKGHVIGETMFAMVNPEGSTKSGEAALKIADNVATHVDAAVMQGISQGYKAAEEMAAATPELAQQAKQLLYEHTRKLGLSPQEMELAGIPKGYFDGMQPPPGAGKGDNYFAMSKAEEGEGLPKRTTEGAGGIEYQVDKATGRLQRTDLGKVREPYNWEAINEQYSPDVVRQLNEDSCISAVGDMLSEGRITQQQLMTDLGRRPDIADLREYLGTEWTSQKRRFNSLAEISDQPWAAELLENAGTDLQKSLHTVVVDGVNDYGNLMIRDPWEGTKYEMTPQQFLKLWNGRAVYRPIVE